MTREVTDPNVNVEEFDCIDCAAPIVRYGSWSGQPKRCAGCESLTWIANAKDREAMRAHMLKTGMIGPIDDDCALVEPS